MFPIPNFVFVIPSPSEQIPVPVFQILFPSAKIGQSQFSVYPFRALYQNFRQNNLFSTVAIFDTQWTEHFNSSTLDCEQSLYYLYHHARSWIHHLGLFGERNLGRGQSSSVARQIIQDGGSTIKCDGATDFSANNRGAVHSLLERINSQILNKTSGIHLNIRIESFVLIN